MERTLVNQAPSLPFPQVSRFCMSFLLLAVSLIISTTASAQTCSQNLDFRVANTSFFANNSSALSRTVGGSIGGSIRNGQLTRISFSFRPQSVNNTNKINVFGGSYNTNSNSVRPTYTCSEGATSVQITIRNVHTKLDYLSTGVSSIGLGNITFSFGKLNGAGTINFQYNHQTFTRPPDSNSILFNGFLLTNATPLSGGKLSITNLR